MFLWYLKPHLQPHSSPSGPICRVYNKLDNKPNAYDMHFLSTLLPCGIDGVTEEDLAHVGLLGLEGSLLALDNPAHELEPEMEDELEEPDTSIEAEENAHK
ncbi:hypothetical protein BGX26_011173 [Mortierella sp. AD094]|nr:hypothetical protein BGX26_011173 [Mortierella sp. AD094]